MGSRLTLAGGIGLGAGLMYLLDPERGKRRRALARDKAVRLLNTTGEAVSPTSRDLANRATGIFAELRSRFTDGVVPDHILVERVRSKMGRFVSHPKSIDVTVEEGRVTLTGPVLAQEVDELIAAVASVPGVTGIDNRLEVHDEPGNVPGLQGGATRFGERPEVLQENWAPATRFLATIGGGSLAIYGLKQRGILGLIFAALGLGVIARGLTNVPIRRMAGAGGRRAIDFHKTININAPVEEVYAFWSNLENFPRFMSHLREVRTVGDDRSHWVAAGPAGVSVEWDAVVTERIPNELLAWRSEPGSTVGNAGIVRFEPNPDGGTRLDIRLSYNPPAGALGHIVATLFGADPKHAMDEDLVRFKSLLEEGRTSAHGTEVTRDELQRAAGEEIRRVGEELPRLEPLERRSSTFERQGSDY